MSPKQRLEKQQTLNKLIKMKLVWLGYSKEDLAVALHISLASLYNKLNDPDKFTYRELQSLKYKLEFSDEEFLKAI